MNRLQRSVQNSLCCRRLLNYRLPFGLRIGIWIIFIYVGVVIVFAFLQRSMIYLPTREARIEPQDAGLPAGQVHTITLRTADGIELHGWHILAEGRTAANWEECQRELSRGRLVLFFSGNGGHRCYRVEECRALTRLDAHVFIFDYRGYGENPGSPSEEHLAADAQAIWQYATRERQVSADRIVIYGESLGGGVAVRLAAELCQSGTAPAGLIVRSTFTSLVDVGQLSLSLASGSPGAAGSLRVRRTCTSRNVPVLADPRCAGYDCAAAVWATTVRGSRADICDGYRQAVCGAARC